MIIFIKIQHYKSLKKFITCDFERFCYATISKDEEILFMDSCHPTQATKFDYGWIKKGEEKQIKTTESRTRINITGVVNIKSRKVVTPNYEKIDSESTIDFLKQVSLKYSDSKTIHIIYSLPLKVKLK